VSDLASEVFQLRGRLNEAGIPKQIRDDVLVLFDQFVVVLLFEILERPRVRLDSSVCRYLC
jgi:hypothetical protein